MTPPLRLRLALLAASCILTAGPASADHYVAPRPTADEVRWHQAFVHLFDAGHTHEAALAADNLERALQGTNDAQGWYILGNDLTAIAQFERAVGAYQKALAYLPDNAAIINNLGIAYKDLGRYDLAIASFRRAASLGDPTARQNVADMTRAMAPPPPRPPANLAAMIAERNAEQNYRNCGRRSGC